ncbi:phosphoadenosine phosphosulfate reductase domain-containing protein [Marinobacterium stanieri]|uniref:Phosphoadenosine phosphosulfate reductase family protein n=1 Tax=Marinobacterium stanieri TaxID=49186 RepID=A0A1N6XKX9_9GAMM|nr:phosphoadenosine phosphosulfate reductase family protein [Marinobacterium stanieri]SIR02879.1 Phosphoadenosine phosphosulfate reductase family protein [Marinobacterium stanieri]
MSHTFDDRVVVPGLGKQIALDMGCLPVEDEMGTYFDAPEIDIDAYDRIVIGMSGGKDSLASLLRLVDMGVDLSKVELWHHDVDGREGSSLMDWKFMADYNRQIAEAFVVPIYFSWLEGGFEGEMLKENAYSKPHKFEGPEGLVTLERDTTRSAPNTRLKFPQVSASLQTRWCSSALKIDVARRQLNNQARFNGKKCLFITGERRQESSNRAKYNQFEPHSCDRRAGRLARHVDAWRPVLHWDEEQVWDALKRHGIIAPVPYRLGWGRSSCMTCIYNSPRIWATISHYFPERARIIAGYEDQFGVTISRDRINVLDVSRHVEPFEIDDLEALEQALKSEYTLPVVQSPRQPWQLPAGAFGNEGCGSD